MISLAVLMLSACGGKDGDDHELGSGAIRGLLNFPGTNAQALDIGFDGSREGVMLGAMQSGPADYGRGLVGRPATEPPVLVLGRYNVQAQALWSSVADGAFTADAAPKLAIDAQGGLLVAIGGFTGDLDVGGGPRAGSLVAQLSLADGFVRWSASLPAEGGPLPRFVAADADGSTVIASSVTSASGTTVRLDRLAGVTGELLTSRALGSAAGNVGIDSMGIDADGNLVTGGSFDATLTLAAAHTAITDQHAGYVAKIGRDSGAALWSRQLRRRGAQDRIIVAPLASGDVAIAGVFAFADDTSDTENPLGPTLYLRIARLSGATGATLWTTRTNLPNTAALDVVDLADNADDLLLSATFSGTFVLGALNAVSTAASSMAMVRFSADDGAPQWLRFSSTTEARAQRIGLDATRDVIGVGTFVSQDAVGNPLTSIFIIRVVQ